MSDIEITVRMAVGADAHCLSAIAKHVFLETYAKTGISLALAREAETQFSIDAFLERLQSKKARIALAERAGYLVAFAEVVLGATHALVPSGSAAELTRLYVQSPFLRQGIGRQLLARAEALALADGIGMMWLTAWVGNERALGFYAAQGYEQLGRTEHVFEGVAVENRLLAKTLQT